MSEYLRRKMPGTYTILATGDWHVGSKAFHEEAAKDVVQRIVDEPATFMLFMGDAVEGKMIDSPHFNPEGLTARHLNAKDQFDHFIDLVMPARDKILGLVQGNHDRYLSRDFDAVEYIADRLGVPKGGYQTWFDLGAVRIHAWHGRASLPRGAKDPVQRDANQRAWLVNRLAPLAGDCHVQLMGHVHALLIQPPIETYALLKGGKNVHARYFREPESSVRGLPWVPVRSRWYGCTGTLRRSGGFGWVDYGEIAGHNPAPIGYLQIDVEDGRVTGIEKVIV